MRRADPQLRQRGESCHRGRPLPHHPADRRRQLPGGHLRLLREEAAAALQLSHRLAGPGRPLGGPGRHALRQRDRPHRRRVDLRAPLLQRLHRHGRHVLHGLHHDSLRDKYRQVRPPAPRGPPCPPAVPALRGRATGTAPLPAAPPTEGGRRRWGPGRQRFLQGSLLPPPGPAEMSCRHAS